MLFRSLVLDEAGVRKGKDFNIAMERASLAAKGLAVSLGGGLVTSLTQVADAAVKVIDRANSLTKGIGGIAGIVDRGVKAVLPFGSALDLFGGKAKGAGGSAKDAAGGITGMAKAAEGAEPKVGLLADSTKLLADHLDPLPHELSAAGGAARDMATDLDKARDAAGDLTTKLDILLGHTVDQEEATSNYEEAIDKLRDQLREKGTDLDLDSEKGRENAAVVRLVVSRIKDHIKALIDNGATQDQVRAQFDKHIADFRRVFTQAGLTTDQIDNLITKYGLVPESVETAVKLAGVEKAIADADRLVDHLVERFGIARKAAEITVTVFGADQAEAQIAAVQRETHLLPLPSSQPAPTEGDGQFIPGEGRAHGGPVLPGYRYPVGEDGPETLEMFRGGGGRVLPGRPRIIGSGGGSSAPSGSVSTPAGIDPTVWAEALALALSRHPLRAEVTASNVARGLHEARRR